MRVRMKRTVPGAADGFTVVQFKEGEEYDLTQTPRSKDLAQVFVREGWAEEIGAAPARERKKVRLPLRDEYVASGYDADLYERFIKSRTSEAELAGHSVEVRERTKEEIEADAKIQAAITKPPPSAAPTPPRPPAPPPMSDDTKKKHRR